MLKPLKANMFGNEILEIFTWSAAPGVGILHWRPLTVRTQTCKVTREVSARNKSAIALPMQNIKPRSNVEEGLRYMARKMAANLRSNKYMSKIFSPFFTHS